MVAAHRGCATAANWLLQHGADWRTTSRRGSTSDQTALDLAKASRKVEVIRVLERWILAHGNTSERAPLEKRVQEEALAASKELEEEERCRRRQLLTDFLTAAKQNVAKWRDFSLWRKKTIYIRIVQTMPNHSPVMGTWFSQVPVMTFAHVWCRY